MAALHGAVAVIFTLDVVASSIGRDSYLFDFNPIKKRITGWRAWVRLPVGSFYFVLDVLSIITIVVQINYILNMKVSTISAYNTLYKFR